MDAIHQALVQVLFIQAGRVHADSALNSIAMILNVRRKIKFLIVATTVLLLVVLGIILLWRNFSSRQDIVNEDGTDLANKFAACKLSPMEGELISITQGTVATIGTDVQLRVGVVSITDNKATLSIWNPSDNTSERKSTLETCESLDVEGSRIYVFAINDRIKNPFGGPGSSNDSLELFVVKSPIK